MNKTSEMYECKMHETRETLENIIIDAIEGGINYWACINNDTELFHDEKYKGKALSEKIVDILLEKKGEVEILDADEDEIPKYKLSIDRLLEGISLNAKNRPWDANLENSDSITADCIIQYAIFDEVIFG